MFIVDIECLYHNNVVCIVTNYLNSLVTKGKISTEVSEYCTREFNGNIIINKGNRKQKTNK